MNAYRVIVERAQHSGVRVSGIGSSVDAEHLVVRDIAASTSDQMNGHGLYVDLGASATVRRLLVEHATSAGLLLSGAVTVTFEDLLVRDTRAREVDRLLGYGVELGQGAAVELRRAALVRNRSAGILMLGPDDVLVAEDLLVRDTAAEDGSGDFGRGLGIQRGDATVTRARIERNHDTGVFVAGSAARLHEVHIIDTRPRVLDSTLGRGLTLQEDAAVTARSLRIDDSRESGIFLLGSGVSLDAEDLVVRGTRPQESDGRFGRGLSVQDGGSVRAARVLLEDNHDVGIIGNGAGSRFDVQDAVVRGTRPNESDGLFGRGINIQDGAEGVFRRVALEGNSDTGAFVVTEESTLRLEDLVVHRTETDAHGRFGRGVAAQEGATLELLRARITDNVEFGVIAIGAGAGVTLSQVEVRGTLPRGDLGGTGIGAFLEARTEAREFASSDNALCGVQVARDASLDLHVGEVARNLVGACVQVDGYDIARLSDGVVYRDNETALDSRSLPVPDVGGTVDDVPP